MIATLPTQEQVDQIARDLAPDVVRIRVSVARDWSEDPAIYFRVILSDEASRPNRLSGIAELVRGKLSRELGLAGLDHIPYFRFRSQSEQANLYDSAWDSPRAYCGRRITSLRMKVSILGKRVCGAPFQQRTLHCFIC